MPIDDRMTVDERRKYLKLVAPRYAKPGRAERSALLTELAAVTGLHRKSPLRLLHGKLRRQWDQAQTPHQRLLATGILTLTQQAMLATLYAETNLRTATGSHLPGGRTAVAASQACPESSQRGSPGTQPKGGGNDPSVTFLHE